MTIKEKVFLDNLLKHLGINNISEIRQEHTKELLEYLRIHKDEEVISDLITKIPNFLNFASESAKSMSAIVTELLQAGETEIDSLKQIIDHLLEMLKMDSITDNDKKEIYLLINRFSDILEKQLQENAELRKKIYGGVFSIVAFSTLMAGFIAYKALGGENGEELITEASKKLIEGTS